MAYAKQQRKKGTLTKDEIVQCAFNLIANKGTEGCSMRALGNELGVSAMALYGYIPSRESLLNEVVERFLKTVDTRALRGERWEDTLIRTTLSLRRAFVSSPHFAELMCDPCVGPGIEPYMLELRLIYLGQGMPEDIAVQLIAITDSYLTGFALRARQNLRIASRSGTQAGRGRCSALCDDIARPRHAHRQSESRRRTTALQRALASNRRRRLFRDLVPKGPTRNYRGHSRRHGRTARELANAAITC